MKFLFDLQHPAHLHFFRNAARRLEENGHEVKFTGRDKDILRELAEKLDVDVEFFGVARPGFLNLGKELIYRQIRLWKIINEFKPDAMMAIAGTFISALGWIRRVPAYVFYDTEHAAISNFLAYPFCNCVFVPQCYNRRIRWRHERYEGFHELAYLHPEYFRPDPGIRSRVGLGADERFVFVRFVSWGAGHDIGVTGLSLADKHKIVESLSAHRRVLISAEGDLPSELEHLRVNLSVEEVHHLLAESDLIFGESGTIPSEGAMLGVPGIYVNPLRMGYLEELRDRYQIVDLFNPDEVNEALEKAVYILTEFDRVHWRNIGRQIIADKIDVTAMLCRIAEERPYSRYAQ